MDTLDKHVLKGIWNMNIEKEWDGKPPKVWVVQIVRFSSVNIAKTVWGCQSD